MVEFYFWHKKCKAIWFWTQDTPKDALATNSDLKNAVKIICSTILACYKLLNPHLLPLGTRRL